MLTSSLVLAALGLLTSEGNAEAIPPAAEFSAAEVVPIANDFLAGLVAAPGLTVAAVYRRGVPPQDAAVALEGTGAPFFPARADASSPASNDERLPVVRDDAAESAGDVRVDESVFERRHDGGIVALAHPLVASLTAANCLPLLVTFGSSRWQARRGLVSALELDLAHHSEPSLRIGLVFAVGDVVGEFALHDIPDRVEARPRLVAQPSTSSRAHVLPRFPTSGGREEEEAKREDTRDLHGVAALSTKDLEKIVIL